MTAHADLACLLAGRGPILLDFDGPVCSIFAGYSAPDVASRLRMLLQTNGVEVPTDLAGEADPLEVLRWTGNHSARELVRTVEDALCSAELSATRSAMPTPYAREVMVAARQAGRAVAVVSNNSAGAIEAYLTGHRLRGHIASIVGRACAEPGRMKPSPEPVLRAARALEANPGECVLIGDSVSDIVAAHAAEVPVIGYANKRAKVEQFTRAGADAVVTSMADIAQVLIESVPVGESD